MKENKRLVWRKTMSVLPSHPLFLCAANVRPKPAVLDARSTSAKTVASQMR